LFFFPKPLQVSACLATVLALNCGQIAQVGWNATTHMRQHQRISTPNRQETQHFFTRWLILSGNMQIT
jgi:hypothetical protein